MSLWFHADGTSKSTYSSQEGWKKGGGGGQNPCLQVVSEPCMQQGDRFLAYVLCTEEAVGQEAATVDDTELCAVCLGMFRVAR